MCFVFKFATAPHILMKPGFIHSSDIHSTPTKPLSGVSMGLTGGLATTESRPCVFAGWTQAAGWYKEGVSSLEVGGGEQSWGMQGGVLQPEVSVKELVGGWPLRGLGWAVTGEQLAGMFMEAWWLTVEPWLQGCGFG